MKALLFHGSPYKVKEFNTLKFFNKDCLPIGNGGILGHYFYYVTKKCYDEKILETLLIPETLRHACKKDGIRGALNSTGFVYIIAVNLKKFLISDSKEQLEFWINNFQTYINKNILSKIFELSNNNKEIIHHITISLLKIYDDYNYVAEILTSTGYNGLLEPCDFLFSTLYIWNNSYITEDKIYQVLKATKISNGSAIKNFLIEELC